jgi:hypothetical protein
MSLSLKMAFDRLPVALHENGQPSSSWLPADGRTRFRHPASSGSVPLSPNVALGP